MRKTENGRTISRVLVTRHDKIGDFTLALPLCQCIKKAAPETELSVLVSKVNFEFAKSLKFIDNVILFDTKFYKTLRTIRRQDFDASISCFIDTRLGVLLWLAGIPRRIAPATKFAQLFFNQTIRQQRSQAVKTEWQYNLELGNELFPSADLSFTPPLLTFDSLNRKNRVVFHPGFGGSSDGNLRLEDYLRLGRAASRMPGITVAYTFGPDDQNSYKWFQTRLDFPASLVESKMPLIEFCKFLAESKLFVSTSTGPMHLAGAVNISTLSFFGESVFASSRRWSTINNLEKQRNFMIGTNYSSEKFRQIKAAMMELIS